MNLDRFREEPSPPFFPLMALIDILFLMIIFLVLGASFDSVATVSFHEVADDMASISKEATSAVVDYVQVFDEGAI